jgi:hypothetical protein
MSCNRSPATRRAELAFAQQRLGCAHDPGLAADLDPIADLKWLLAAPVTGRDHLLAPPELKALVNSSHER